MQPSSSLPAAPLSRDIWILMAAGLAGSANIRAFDSALPHLADSFGISLGQTGHFGAAYALAYGLCQLPFGIMGDRADKLKLVRLLAVASLVVVAATSFASSYEAMLVLRLLAGAAASAVIPLTIAHIGATIPFEQRQMALAWNMTALTSGLILGQILGGALSDLVGWQMIPIAISCLYLPAVVGLGSVSAPPTSAAMPLAPLQALKKIAQTPFSRAVLYMVAAEGILVYAVSAFFGLALSMRFGLNAASVGILLAVYALGSICNLFLVRYLPKSWGMKGHFSLGAAAASCGLFLVGYAPSLIFSVLGLFLAGLGAAALHNNLQTFGSQLLPEARATGFATFATTFFLAQAAGGIFFAWAIDRYGLSSLFLWPLPLIALFAYLFLRCLPKRT